MKRIQFRKTISIFAICVLILTSCVLLSFVIDRSAFAGNLVKRILNILAPFLIGGIIAFILKPLCNFLDRLLGELFAKKLFRRRLETGKTTERRLRRSAARISILLAMLFFFGVLYALLYMVLPQLYWSVYRLVTSIPMYLQRLTTWLLSVIGEDNPYVTENIRKILTNFNEFVSNWLNSTVMPWLNTLLSGDSSALSQVLTILTGTIGIGRAVISVLLDIIVSIVVAVYVLAGRKKFTQQGMLIIHSIFSPVWARRIIEEIRYTDHVFSRFLSGKMLDSLCVGVLVFTVSTIVGVPQAALVSTLVGFSNMIPFFGPYIGSIPSALIILMIDPIKCIYFILLVIVIQQLDGNILDPMIVGNSIEMSSFWILFSVLLFGGLYGFAGLVLGVPTFAVIYDIARKLINYGLRKRGREELLDRYQESFHDPLDDGSVQRERAREQRRKKKIAMRTKEEVEQIECLMHEAQSAGTTEADSAELHIPEENEPTKIEPGENKSEVS